MGRLTRRAETEGVKAVYYGKNDVFLEGEPGYVEADKLAHYEDLEEAGRLMILPETYDKERFKDENCPTVLGLKDTCDVEDCNICWEIALKGETSEWINTNGTKKSAEKSISST